VQKFVAKLKVTRYDAVAILGRKVRLAHLSKMSREQAWAEHGFCFNTDI
jgi:hypothetical protein